MYPMLMILQRATYARHHYVTPWGCGAYRNRIVRVVGVYVRCLVLCFFFNLFEQRRWEGVRDMKMKGQKEEEQSCLCSE